MVFPTLPAGDRLNANDLFALFPSHIRHELTEKAETRLFKRGDVLFRKGDDGPWLGSILTGRVRMSRRTADGRELLLSMVERGEIFGERAVYDCGLRSSDATAVAETAVQIFQRDQIVPLLYAYPDTLMYIVRTLCNRLHRHLDTLELFALHSLPVRLANLLLAHSLKYGIKTPEGTILKTDLSQSDLAHQAAATRESVNRQLKAFMAEGLIHLHGQEILICDPRGLEAICQTGAAPDPIDDA